MMPGMNKRSMEQAMKKMGVKQVDIPANEVVIKCDDREIVISNPSVAKVAMMGQESWQITGSAQERGLETSPEINEEDVQTVMEQTSVSEEDAKKAIEDAGGDLAQAIMSLQDQ